MLKDGRYCSSFRHCIQWRIHKGGEGGDRPPYRVGLFAWLIARLTNCDAQNCWRLKIFSSSPVVGFVWEEKLLPPGHEFFFVREGKLHPSGREFCLRGKGFLIYNIFLLYLDPPPILHCDYTVTVDVANMENETLSTAGLNIFW